MQLCQGFLIHTRIHIITRRILVASPILTRNLLTLGDIMAPLLNAHIRSQMMEVVTMLTNHMEMICKYGDVYCVWREIVEVIDD